tara:strand:- start:69 stop:401 length:333 start_codon:yes stop_codon:yes gene_type:complete
MPALADTFDGRTASAGSGSMIAVGAHIQRQVRELHAAAPAAGGFVSASPASVRRMSVSGARSMSNAEPDLELSGERRLAVEMSLLLRNGLVTQRFQVESVLNFRSSKKVT